jgi:hypothetical protein
MIWYDTNETLLKLIFSSKKAQLKGWKDKLEKEKERERYISFL